MEVRTRVLRDQLGVKLAKEANVDFDAPQIVAIESPPEGRPGERPRTRSGGPRENRGPKRAMQGRPDRGARGGENRFERDAAPRRAPPAPSTPERRRKHVSALRAEIAADAATTRKRVERSATQDRKGRTIAVERMSRAVEEAHTHTASETRPKRAGRPNAGERGGRSFESGGRAGRGDSFGPKSLACEAEPPEGASGRRGRTRRNAGVGPRGQMPRGLKAARASVASIVPQRSGMAIAEMARRERTMPGIRRANASLTGLKAERVPQPARADRHDRTLGAAGRASAASIVPQRSGTAISREGPPRTRNGGDPTRERKFDRPQGRPRTQAGEGRPQRSDDKNRGPRSDFKSPRAGGRDGDRPRSPGRGPGSEGGGPPRGRSSPERRPRPPGKGPPKGGGGSRRPPRKP